MSSPREVLSNKIINMELLAPAGSEESLTAAIRCGADAVYLGAKHLNARRGAKNFEEQELAAIVSDCHRHGVNVYLALNTVVFDSELHDLASAVKQAALSGVDALIVQDLAVAAVAKACAPDIPLHGSTQMSIHNLDGAKALEKLGFSRAILARELSCREIAEIAGGTSLAVECFVHGALCMSVSGQCYLSSIIGGRSGNRGLCAQPCRLPFTPGKDATDHALSLRDLSLIPHLEELAGAGVASIKIEGRMKRPEYVAAAVTACRAALDGGAPDMATLEAVFSRSGFTDGYFADKRDGNMFGTRQKDDVISAAGVLGGLSNLYRNENARIPIAFSLTLQSDQATALTCKDRDGHSVTVTGDVPQDAITAPTTVEKASASLGKTGGTPYMAESIAAEIGLGLMLPASRLNDLRRRALEELDALRSATTPHPFQEQKALLQRTPYKPKNKPIFRVRLHSYKQLTPALAVSADEIILPLAQLGLVDQAMLPKIKVKLLAEIPPMAFGPSHALDSQVEAAKSMGITKLVAGNPGGVELAARHGCSVHGDYCLNITNTLALNQYEALGLSDATVSFELELPRIASLGGKLRRGMLGYGYLPLMKLRNCPLKASRGCKDCKGTFPTLTDRTGAQFFLDCQNDLTTLYNWVPLFMGDRMRELVGVDFITLYFTKEEPWECEEILSRYQRGEDIIENRTRGLYYRKVL